MPRSKTYVSPFVQFAALAKVRFAKLADTLEEGAAAECEAITSGASDSSTSTLALTSLSLSTDTLVYSELVGMAADAVHDDSGACCTSDVTFDWEVAFHSELGSAILPGDGAVTKGYDLY